MVAEYVLYCRKNNTLKLKNAEAEFKRIEESFNRKKLANIMRETFSCVSMNLDEKMTVISRTFLK